MAVTVAAPSQNPGLGSAGSRRVAVKDVTFDSSYPTGGESIAAVDFGLTRIAFGTATVKTATVAAGGTVASVAVIPQSDGSALLKCSSTTAEIANATDLSALVVTVVIWGDV